MSTRTVGARAPACGHSEPFEPQPQHRKSAINASYNPMSAHRQGLPQGGHQSNRPYKQVNSNACPTKVCNRAGQWRLALRGQVRLPRRMRDMKGRPYSNDSIMRQATHGVGMYPTIRGTIAKTNSCVATSPHNMNTEQKRSERAAYTAAVCCRCALVRTRQLADAQ